MKKLLATLLLSSCLLITGCSTAENEETKELEKIQQNIEDAGIQVSYVDDFIVLDLSKAEVNGAALNQELYIGFSDDLQSVEWIAQNYRSDGIHYSGIYHPNDDTTLATLTIGDTPVCSMFNVDTQESYDDSSECYSEYIDYINFLNGVLEDTMDTYNLSYNKLEKWAIWALENNS